jgi:hypothetical protein
MVEGHADCAASRSWGRPATSIQVWPGAEVEATFVDLHPMHHLDIVRRVFDQGKVEASSGTGRVRQAFREKYRAWYAGG